MGINQILITIGLISIFCLAFINFGIQFGIDQEASININNESSITGVQSSVKTNSANFIVTGNSTNDAVSNSVIESTSASGSFSRIKIFTSALTAPFAVMYSMFGFIGTTIFGGDNQFGVILGIISTTMLLIGAFLGYKLLKGGNPD